MYRVSSSGNTHGFTLVEVLIGMAILTIVIGGCLAAFPEIRTVSTTAQRYRDGSTLVDRVLEEWRTQTFAQLRDTLGESSETLSVSDEHHLLGEAGGAYYLSTTSEDLNNQTYRVRRIVSPHASNESGVVAVETIAVVDWVFRNRRLEVCGRAFFTEGGLSDKKFHAAN